MQKRARNGASEADMSPIFLRFQRREKCLEGVTAIIEKFLFTKDIRGMSVGVSLNGHVLYKKGKKPHTPVMTETKTKCTDNFVSKYKLD